MAGAEVRLHTLVTGLSQRPDETWDVQIEGGDPIHAEHVVNAGGLWAREVGRMVGLELPVLAMEHQYVLTADVPEIKAFNESTGKELPMTIDFGGEIYVRQEGGGMLLGTYEQDARPWSPEETPWDFGSQLLKPDLDRITPEMSVASKHIPSMATVGIKQVVNGPFTFAPDGNPLVGPIRGLRNYWLACGVMAGLSQGGGVGLALAAWMSAGDAGDSGMDIFGMDIARFGDYAKLAYTNAKVQENYKRRFQITFPNEELPAARPLRTTPIYDRLTAANAVWGASLGLEHALWFQEAGLEPKEDVTFRRSNAWECVAGEVAAVRERVGVTEISNYAKYRVTGPGAEAWLSSLLTARMPQPGRIVLTAMLNEAGRIVGEFTVARPTEADEYYLFGSLAAEVHHPRWFAAHLPADGSVTFEVLGLSLVGLSIAGPHARDTSSPRSRTRTCPRTAFRFMDFRRDRGRDHPGARRPDQLQRRARLRAVGRAGVPARRCSTGSWPPARSTGSGCSGSGPDVAAAREELRHVVSRVSPDLHAPRGRASSATSSSTTSSSAARRTRRRPRPAPSAGWSRSSSSPTRTQPADVIGDEPIWHDGAVVGWVTSGAYGHHVEESIALGYVPAELATPDGPGGSGSRSRSSGGAGRPGSSPSRCSTRRVSGCASDRGRDGGSRRSRPTGGGRIVVDGRPVAFERGRLGRDRDPARRRGARAGAARCAWPAIAATVSPRSTASPTSGRARPRPDPGLRVARHPAGAMPALPVVAATDLTATPLPSRIELHHLEVDVAVIGGGSSGLAAAAEAERAGKSVRVLDAHAGEEVVGDLRRAADRGPDDPRACSTSIRARSSSRRAPPRSIRSCPGNRLAGIVTARAAERLRTPAWTWAGSSRWHATWTS